MALRYPHYGGTEDLDKMEREKHFQHHLNVVVVFNFMQFFSACSTTRKSHQRMFRIHMSCANDDCEADSVLRCAQDLGIYMGIPPARICIWEWE